MFKLISFIMASLIGTTILVNGVSIKTDDIMQSARTAVNQANIHQIRNALELYYLDENHYPNVDNSADLISLLEGKHYLLSRPQDVGVIKYSVSDNGQDYELNLQ